MKQRSTDQLLTLGMALTSDKRTMERRVRGVFARRKSARGVLILSLLLVLALGFAAFTTACQPGRGMRAQTRLAAETLSAQDEALRAEALLARDATLETSGAFLAPRFGGAQPQESGSWARQIISDGANQREAKARFLRFSNDIFDTNYAENDVSATYYRDKTGVRADLWRIDSKDGALSGALNADTLKLISAQCKTIPSKAQHASIIAGKTFDESTQQSLIDTSSLVKRIANTLNVTVYEHNNSAYQTTTQAGFGWGVVDNVLFLLDDGTFGSVYVYGDERLTPFAVAIYPDDECLIGNVYWRADLQRINKNVTYQNPSDFRIGKPNQDDMQQEEALTRYAAFLAATGDEAAHANPEAVFYQDYSGARENYWLLRAGGLSMKIAAKTGHVFDLFAMGGVGQALDLPPVDERDETRAIYEAQTQRMLEAILGEGVIIEADFDSISDDTNCTVVCKTSDGASYDAFYSDRALLDISYRVNTDGAESRWFENWLADHRFVNIETGEAFFDW